MGTPVIVPFRGDYNRFLQEEFAYCSTCRTRIAFVQHLVNMAEDGTSAVFKQVFNVVILPHVRVVNGLIIANTYCSRCRMFLGWILIAVRHVTTYFRAGRFWMNLTHLVYSDRCTMSFPYEMFDEQNDDQVGQDNEPNDDQDGGDNEQYHDQDEGADAQDDGQDGVAYEQDHDQDGDAAVDQPTDGIDNIDLTPNSRDKN